MKLLLVRHAESSGQQPNADLTPRGHEQARDLAATLDGMSIGSIFSSPYRRAISTIEPFAARAKFPITIIDNLRERTLSVIPVPDFLIHMERSFQDWNYVLPGGESMRETLDRGRAALAQISQLATDKPVLVSHGNLISCILKSIDASFGYDDWRKMTNPDVFEVELSGGRPRSFRHLGAGLTPPADG